MPLTWVEFAQSLLATSAQARPSMAVIHHRMGRPGSVSNLAAGLRVGSLSAMAEAEVERGRKGREGEKHHVDEARDVHPKDGFRLAMKAPQLAGDLRVGSLSEGEGAEGERGWKGRGGE